MTLNIQIKRAYEPEKSSDGKRILVERLWPRGLSKEDAHIDLWYKNIAPSTELRKWYSHELERWTSFKQKYIEELKANPEAVSELCQLCKGKKITFIYAAHDELHNSAVVLKQFLEQLS